MVMFQTVRKLTATVLSSEDSSGGSLPLVAQEASEEPATLEAEGK